MHLAISTLCSGTSHVVPPRRAKIHQNWGYNSELATLFVIKRRIFNDNDIYDLMQKLDIDIIDNDSIMVNANATR